MTAPGGNFVVRIILPCDARTHRLEPDSFNTRPPEYLRATADARLPRNPARHFEAHFVDASCTHSMRRARDDI